ncbi:MAG: SUMF1/EgtB/PvdO family nonheme iron enzyme [Pirellulales bacterium]
MTNSIAAFPRTPHRVLVAVASLVALSSFCTPFIAITSGQDRPAATTNRNIVVEGTLFEPLEGVATSGNAGLFIGVNEFTKDNRLNWLEFAVHDAVEQAYLFVFELKLIPAENCFLLLSGAPTTPPVQRHLEQLKAAKAVVGSADRTEILLTLEKLRGIGQQASDLLVCSVSSHGFIANGRPYVMPSDGLKTRLGQTAVELDLIEGDMEQSRAGHRLLFVDACQERVAAKTIGAPAADRGMDAAFKQAFASPTGQYKLASCSPKQLSYENRALGNVGHGVFTYALLEALRGGAASDGQNFVRLREVEAFVSKYLANWSTEAKLPAQTPFVAGAMSSRDLPLARKAGDLATLVASVRRQPTTEAFTADLRGRLATTLGQLDLRQEADRELVSSTRGFVNNMLPANVFVAYLRAELERRHLPRPPTPLEPASVIENSIGAKLVLIPAGEFQMGSPASDTDAYEDERPQHRVRLSKPYYLGKYEVTQREWKVVMGTEPWKGIDYVREGDEYPAMYISYEEAEEFCRRLSARPAEKAAGRVYRLPTEAEWEYGCRGGNKQSTRYHFGDGEDELGEYAWYDKSAWDIGEKYAHIVGQKRANGYGLHDMHGNVYEWCSDWYSESYYATTAATTSDPTCPSEGSYRCVRGGSFGGTARFVRCATRYRRVPSSRFNYLGFRVAASPMGTPASGANK